MVMTYKFNFLGVEELNALIKDYLVNFVDVDLMQKAATKSFFKVEEKLFNSEGVSGASGKWKSLNSKYRAWKENNYGGKPIMQLTGQLKRTLTGKDTTSYTLQQVDNETAQLVIYNNYWHNHQYGSTVPVRRTVDLTDKDQAFIVDSMLKSTLGGRLSRLFSRG